MKRFASLMLCICLFLSLLPIVSANEVTNEKPKVIPSLQQWTGGAGQFQMTADSKIIVDDSVCNCGLQEVAETFQQDLNAVSGVTLNVVGNTTPLAGDFVLKGLATENGVIGEEGYLFDVTDYVTISANTYQGVFYGTQTALQIITQDAAKRSIPKGSAVDFPKYEMRGFMLDVGRKFVPMEDLKEYVKIMGYYKLNEFQLHLSDNAIFKDTSRSHWNQYTAFRLENETFPGLTAEDGSYSKQEFRQLQDLAAGYGVNITPELDTPSHALSFTKVKPEYTADDIPVDHLDIRRPEVVEFIKDVWREYLNDDWFDGEYIHIGADEFYRYDAVTSQYFREFLNEMTEFVVDLGKTPRMWGSLNMYTVGPEVNKDIVAQIWNSGWQNAQQSINEGFKIINSLDGNLYIVPKAGYYYDYLNKEWLYNNWAPHVFSGGNVDPDSPNLLGSVFALWNDLMGEKVSNADVHARITDAVPVFAQKTWAANNSDMNYAQFNQLSQQLGLSPSHNLFYDIESGSDVIINYDFDDVSNGIVQDQSGNGYDAELVNASVVSEGKNGSAIQFDSSTDHVEIGLSRKGVPWALSAWVNLDNVDGNESILMESDLAALKLKQRNSTRAGFSREGYNFTFNATIPTGRWVHVVYQGDLNGTSLYIDGELAASVRETLSLPVDRLGSRTSAMEGLLDDVKIFNRLMTPSEIVLEAGSPPWTANLAVGKTAVASSLETPNFPAALVNDGQTNTRWSSGTSNNQWIYIDLGEETEVGKVVLRWENSYARSYKIQVSDDAQNWHDVYSRSVGAGGVETITFPAERTRYVRMLGLERATTYGFSLYEFEIYSPNPSQPVPIQESVRYVQDFENNDASNWIQITGSGSKSLVDAPNQSGQKALRLDAAGSSNVFVDSLSPELKDGEIEFTITPTTDSIRAGVIFRYIDDNNWASFGYDGGSWYWVNAQDSYGRLTNDAGARLYKNQTSTVKVRFEGNSFSLIVNGTTYFNGSLNSLPSGEGKMGARVFGSTTAIFDNFKYNNFVNEVPVTSITLSTQQLQLAVNETASVTALIKPGNANNRELVWSSSDDSIATVSSANETATILGVSGGEVVITVTNVSSGVSSSVVVTVIEEPTIPIGPKSVITSPNVVRYGQQFQVIAGIEQLEKIGYAEDISVLYDRGLMQYIESTSLFETVQIIDELDSNGVIRILLASQGANHGILNARDLLQLTFRALDGQEDIETSISIIQALIGHGDGSTTIAENSNSKITFISEIPSGDVNGDGEVTIGDLAIVAAYYGATRETSSNWNEIKKYDLTRDGKINIEDLTIIAQLLLSK